MNSQLNIPQDLRDHNCQNFKHEITLKDVDFLYDDNNIVFNKINLTINKGDKVVLTGPSGSGKTTLIDLITGLIKPTKGNVFIDNINITEKNAKICNTDISYFDQNIYMSNDSIANNITLGRNKDREKMASAIKQSSFSSNSKENSILELQVGESGSRLSGGQKQRLAIARTLYADAKIQIFDEPTSSLDDNTALDLVKNLFIADDNKTIIVIDHRGHFKKYANKIIKIEDKTVIIERG
jgi:ABC-type multidrug transport system fused ATPase/permease subunit